MEEETNRSGEVTHIMLHNFFKNYFKFISAENKLQSLKGKKAIDKWTDERDAQLFSTVISSALLIEAFINEYGAVKLETLFDDYLERIDLLAKCVLIPKLADGINLETNISVLNRLKRLIKIRNRLVHPKLFEVPDDFNQVALKLKSVKDKWDEAIIVAKDSLSLVYDFGKYLNKFENSYSMAAVLEYGCKKQIEKGRFVSLMLYR